MNRSFTIDGVTKEVREFQAFKKSDVIDRCHKKNDAIYMELCKLTYLKSLQTHHHWVGVLASIITDNATNSFKGKFKFNYDWFFEFNGAADEYDAEVCFESLDKKYNNIKPNNPDFERLADNMNIFRQQLTDQSAIKGRLLTNKEVKEIIESLDLYDGTQD